MALVKDALGRETQPSSSSGSNAKSMSIGDLRKQEYSGTPVSTSDGQSSSATRPAGRQKRIVAGNGVDVVAASNANPKNQEWKRSIRTAGSMVSETGKSVYDTMAEGELYYRQTGRQSDTIKRLMESDPYYETDRENYRKERDKKFELYEGKWQLASTAGQGGDQADPLEEFKGSTDYKVWDIKKNGFNGFDFTTVYNKYGNGYNLNREAIDWISNRFRASFEKYYDGYDEDQMRKAQGLMPRSTEYSYRRNSKDQQLLSLGLPPSSYLDDYVQDYIDWIGDGQYWAIQDGEAKDWIVQQWQSTWKYETTPEDIERKRNGEMPYKVEQKYRKGSTGWGDITKSYADEMYLSMGLPPASDIDDLVGAYETHATNQNRIQQFYGTVAASWYKIGLDYGNDDADIAYQTEDGADVTVGQLREQAFIDSLNSEDFADVRGLYHPVEAAGEVDEAKYINDPLGLFDAQYKADGKADAAAEKLAGTDYVSYDDFLALYPGMRTEIGTQRVVDEAVVAARGDNYTYADLEAELQEQRDAEMFAGIGTKQDALAYVDNRSGDDPIQILNDLFDGGVDFKHVRQAKNYLADQYSGPEGKKTRDAIFARFGELKEKNQERTNAQIDAAAESDRSVAGNFGRMFLMTAGGMGGYDPEAYQAQAEKLVDVVGEDKERKDRIAANAGWFNQNVVAPYLRGDTSSMTKVEAVTMYESMLERDDDGKVSAESAERAREALIDAGVSGYMAEQVASETASASGGWQDYVGGALRSANRNPAAIEIGASPFSASMQALEYQTLKAGEADMRELIAQTRERVVGEGIMTGFELDNAVRQAGWGSVLDATESAKDYFVAIDYGRSIESTGTDVEKAAWQSATPIEQQEIATAVWDGYTNDVKTSYTGWFAENAMVNPDVAKTNEEVLRYQGIGAVATKAAGGIVSGAVNLVDMGAAVLSGRSERWKFTEEVTDFTNFITNYGRSNQSYLTEGISLASDVGAEVLRMYTLNAAGGAVGKAFGATKAGAALTATANSATASRGMRFLANAGLHAVRSQPFILTATGNYYAEAMQSGATAQQATWYAIICGALEGGLEQINADQWVAKGLGGRKVAEQLISGGTKAMRSGIVNTAKLISLTSSFCGEFTEESLSYVASYWMQRATYNKDAKFSLDEMFESGFMGGLVGLFGAGLSLGSYSASNIATEYAAKYGVNSANLDIAAIASRVDAWSAEKRAQESMAAEILPLNEYATTAFGLAQADAAIKAANSRYDTFVSEAKAGIDAKSKRLTSLGRQITNARNNGDINKVGKIMRQYAEVKTELQKAIDEFQAQDQTNRQARDTSVDQNKRSMAKANARLDSHDIALYNLFQEDIAAMREKMDADIATAAEAPNLSATGDALDAQYAGGAVVDPDALDAATATMLDSQSIIRNGQRRVAQADAVLSRTMEKMRAARGGNVAEFLEAQLSNGIMDASGFAPTSTTGAEAHAESNSTVTAEKAETEPLQPVATASAPTQSGNAQTGASITRVALTDAEKSAVIDTAKRLGRSVEFRDDMRPWENGYYENGILVLNPNQQAGSDGDALRSTVYRVLTHEMTHSIEGTAEYAKFADFVCSEYQRRGGDLMEAYQGIIKYYSDLSGGEVKLSLADARKELVSNYAQRTLLTDESAIDTIVREQSGFAGRVLNWIQYQIAKTGARKAPESDMALSLLKAERLYTKAFAAAGKNPNDGLRQNAVAGAANTWDDYFGGRLGDPMRDAQYAAAVQSNDAAKIRSMLDEQAERKLRDSKARDESGKLILFYHGTPTGGFTVFDPSKAGGEGFFFVNAKDVAQSYVTGDLSASADLESLNNNALRGGAGLYSVYLDMRNPMIIDCNNSTWDNIQDKMLPHYNMEVGRNAEGQYTVRIQDFTGEDEFPPETYASRAEMLESLGDLGTEIGQELALAEMDFEDGNSEFSSDDGGFSFSAFVERNLHKAKGEQWRMMSEDELEPTSTDNYVEIAKANGHDGVIFTHLADVDDKSTEIDSLARGGDTVGVVFSSNQIKSADPVTNDDAGAVIPLSRRFDDGKSDIRYSMGADDGTGSGDPFADMIERYGSLKPGRQPHARDINVPQQTTDSNRVGLTIRSILESSHASDDIVATLQQKIVDGEIGTYTPVSNRETLGAAQANIARIGVEAAQEQFAKDVESGTAKGATDIVARGEQLLAAAAARGDAESSIKLVSDLCILGTQLGRSVQAFNMLKDMGPLGSAYYFQRSVEKVNKERSKDIDRGKMNPVSIDPALMNQLLNAKTDTEQQQAERDITSHIGDQIPPTIADRLSAWRYFAMLANPRTHIRNMLGNAMMAGLRGAKDAVATGLEKAAVSAGVMQEDQRAHAVYRKSAQAERVAHAENMYKKYRSDVVNGGKLGFDDMVRRDAKQVKSESLDALIKFNSDLLEHEDEMFLKPAFVNAFTQYTVANGIDPSAMTAEQESTAAKWSVDEAQRATFRDASALASYLNRLSRLNPGMKLAVEGLVPFKKTPINVAKRGADYSPIGIVEGVCMAAKGVKDGKYSAAQAVDRLASGLTGTALMAMGAFLAKAGIIRGKGEEKEDYETFLQDNGEQLYSINVGNVSMDISSVAPATIPLFMGASLMEALQSGDARASLSDMIGVVASATNPLMEMSFLSSINDALKSYGSSGGVGGNIGSVALKAGESYASQYLPTIGGSIAAFADPVQRTASGSAASPLGTGMDYFARSLVKKIPGAASLLEPVVNVKGQQATKDSFGEWALDFANRFILPGNVKIKDRGMVDRELIRVYEETAEIGILPTDPPKYFTANGERINLTAKQYTQYSQERGQAVYAAIKSIITSPAYKSAPADKQSAILKKAVENAEGTVRDLWKEKLS